LQYATARFYSSKSFHLIFYEHNNSERVSANDGDLLAFLYHSLLIIVSRHVQFQPNNVRKGVSTGELTALPRPLAGFRGKDLMDGEGKTEVKEWRKGKRGKGGKLSGRNRKERGGKGKEWRGWEKETVAHNTY